MAVEINLGIEVDLLKHFEEIRENLKKNPTADYVASRGEYLNAVLVAAFLEYDFVDTANLIRFDSKGKLLAEETNEAIREELSKHERAVLPGFYALFLGAVPILPGHWWQGLSMQMFMRTGRMCPASSLQTLAL